MHKYGINICWSEEDQVFIAKVPELPGCITHGDTTSLALANAEQAIQAWIDTANKFGDPIPKPKGERVASHARAKHRAVSRSVSAERSSNPRNNINLRSSQPTMNPKAH